MTEAAAPTGTELADRGDGYLLNLFATPEGIADPPVWFHRLRAEMPVFRSNSGALFLSRYEDCRALLRDNRFGKGERLGGNFLNRPNDPAVVEFRRMQIEQGRSGAKTMLDLNPPDHTRLRSLVSRAFTPRRIEAMRDHIVQIGHECMDDLADRGEADAIEVLGFLPVNVIGQLVGVPRADWVDFRALVTAGVQVLEPINDLETLKTAAAAFEQMRIYFADLADARSRAPQDDLISALLEVEDDGDRLSRDELIGTVILLYAAGMETTQNLIGNGLGALFRNPGQLDRLWADPSLVDSAVEEMLRWDSPVQFDGRFALESAEISGVDVAAGETVVTLIGAANRDPDRFADPDRFDVGRDQGPALSFASGIHFCLGANLARAEAQETFRGLIDRFSCIELAGPLEQSGNMILRGYREVRVRVTPR